MNDTGVTYSLPHSIGLEATQRLGRRTTETLHDPT